MQTLCKIVTLCLLSNLPQEDAFQHAPIREGKHSNYPWNIQHGIFARSGWGESVDPEEKQAPRIAKGGDFRTLVTQSTFFADKSLLIKAVIEDAVEGLLITMPRRWGKTVNLDMIKRFLEIPVDRHGKVIEKKNTDNYKLFAGGEIDDSILGKLALLPLEISSVKLFNTIEALDIQGTYPVIYFDLKNCKADDFHTVERLMRAELGQVFSDHAYLLEKNSKLSAHQRRSVMQYLEESEDVLIERGLKVLSRALYDYHGQKKVWILIDEYDAVINEAYENPNFSYADLKRTVSLLKRLYEISLKKNDSLERAVVTGVQFIAKASAGSGLNNLDKVDITTPQYAPYYGLSQEEFEQFFKIFGVPDEYFEDARRWYNGYTVRVYDQLQHRVTDELESKYNVWSVVSYLKAADFKNFESHWEDSGSLDFLGSLFGSPLVKEGIERLMEEKDGKFSAIQFTRERSFSDKDFMILKEMMGGNKVVEKEGANILFSYLFSLGYLTVDALDRNAYRLPNREIKHEMGKRLLEYYQTINTVDYVKIQGLTNVLQEIMDTSVVDRVLLQASLRKFYDQFKETIQAVKFVNDEEEEGVLVNEDVIHSILNYIALQVQYAAFGSEIYTTKLDSKDSKKDGKADIKIANEKIGIIIETKCVPTSGRGNRRMRDALKQAINYRRLLDTTVPNLFIAINVEKEAGISEERVIELLYALDGLGEREVNGFDTMGKQDDFGVDTDIFEEPAKNE